MKKSVWILIQLFAAMSTCRSFGQSGPNLLVNGEIRSFDSRYVTEATPDMRDAILSLIRGQIRQARALGIRRIGNVELAELERQILTVRFQLVEKPASAVGIGESVARFSSVYNVEQRSVYVNLSETVERRVQVSAHEILGASGIDDQNSEFSILLANPEGHRDLIELLNSPGANFPHRLSTTPSGELTPEGRSSGGVTVVGGGGDGAMIDLKHRMMMFRAVARRFLKILCASADTNEEMRAHRALHAAARAQLSDRIGRDICPDLDDQLLTAYDLYLLRAPIEALPASFLRPNGEQLHSSRDTHFIIRIMSFPTARGGEVAGRFTQPYASFAPEYWDIPIVGMTLEDSRTEYALQVYVGLFPQWVKDVYDRK